MKLLSPCTNAPSRNKIIQKLGHAGRTTHPDIKDRIIYPV